MTKRAIAFLAALILSIGTGLTGPLAWASHLRGTSVSWQPTATSGTVQFTIQYSQRTSAGGCGTSGCIVGGTISVPFSFGDGTSTNVTSTITSVNSAQDYFAATGTVTHTYTSAGPFTAFYMQSARVTTIKSGANDYLRMETIVYPFANPVNHPPVSAMPAIVTVPLQATTGFTVVATDQDQDTLTYRLATATEMYNLSAFSCPSQQPPGLSINNSGQVTWDTTQIAKAGCGFSAPVSGDLWTVQFMIEDRDSNNVVKSKTPVDIIVQFIASTEAPPTLQLSNPGPINVAPGTPITFNVTGNDVTANSRVSINATGLPVGAVATNTNQSLIPPVNSTFTWTPTVLQAGSYVVTFSATNDTFQQVLSSVTINVSSILPPVLTCTPSLTAQFNVAVSLPLVVLDPQGEAVTVDWSVDGTVVHTDTVPAGSVATTLTLSPVFASLGGHTVKVVATNSDKVSSSCSTAVTTNPADQTISFPALPNMTYGDPDVMPGATASSGLPVTYAASGSCSILNGAVHASAVGQCSVTATQAGDSNNNPATPVTRQFTIAQHALAVTAQNATKAYGAANPAFTGTIAGVVNNDVITATYSSTATPTSPVGTYPIVPAASGSALANYLVTLTNGTLTVTQTATKVTVGSVPTTVTSGGDLGTITATVQDASNYTVTASTAPVTATVTGPSNFSATVTAAAAKGVASLNLSNLPLKAAGNYTVSVSSNGLAGSTVAVTVTAGTASTLVSSSLPTTITSGGNPGTFTTTVEDANGNTVLTSTAPVSATVTGPNGYSQTITGAAVNGVATLNLASLSLKTAGAYTVTTSSNGLTGTTANFVVAPGTASAITTSAVPASVVSGSNLGVVTATVKDVNGNTVTNSTATIVATVTGPNGFSQSVSAAALNGVASLNLGSLSLKTAGPYTVTTSSSGLTPASSNFTVAPGTASTLVAGALPSSVTSGSNAGTLTETVEDANGNTVTTSNATVTATITGPNGFSQTISAAAVNGVASLNLDSLSLKSVGTYTVTTSSNGLTGTTSTFTVTSAAASKLVVSGAPASVTNGSALGSITATVEDANGNTVTSSTAPVTATVTGPNGYSQTVSGTAAGGIATLNLSTLKPSTAGTYTITTTSAGLTPAISTFNLTAAAATQLVTSPVPSTLTSGGSLGTVTATVEDANGNTVTTSNAAVSATITGPNGFSQTISAAAVNGVAGLNLATLSPKVAGNYTVTISSNGLTSATSALTVNPGAASKLVNGALPTAVASGGTLGTMTSTVEDANGNTVTSSSATVTATITGPNGYSQTVTANAVNGVASLNLSSLKLGAAGTYTVTTSGTGLATSSSTITVGAATATQLVTSPVPATLTSGGNLGTVTATVEDANGNTVTNSNAAVAATISGPNGFSQTVSASAVNGVASLNLGALGLKTAGVYTVTTSSNGLTGTTSSVTVNPGQGTDISLGAIPTSITSGQSFGTISATIRDSNGNVVTGSTAQVTATLTGPNGYSQTIVFTAVNGVLTMDLSSLKPTAAGTYTLSFSGSGLTPVSSTLTIDAASQTITLPTLPNLTYGAGAVALPSTTSAGLPITYTVTGPAAVNGSSLVITGAGAVTVTATQAGDASHSPVTSTKTFTVGQAASTATVVSSSNVLVAGSPVTITVQVASTAGTPTGTATFLNGDTVLGQAAVNSNGVATLNLSNLPTGNLKITASYSGDGNFLGTLSPALGVAVQDFGLTTTAGTAQPIVPGAAASFTLALTPGSSGFSSGITLAASGLPTGATYSFSPATVTPGSAVVKTVLKVQTPKPVAAVRNLGGAAGVAIAFLIMPFGFSRRARAKLQSARTLSLIGALLVLGSVTGLTGCGSGNGFLGQGEKSYTVTVTATSGKLVHTTTVVVSVE